MARTEMTNNERAIETCVPISELLGKPRELTEQYIYDYDRQESYILSVELDDKHEGMCKVSYYDGHGGRWWDDDIDPTHLVELRHVIAIERLQAELAALRRQVAVLEHDRRGLMDALIARLGIKEAERIMNVIRETTPKGAPDATE